MDAVYHTKARALFATGALLTMLAWFLMAPEGAAAGGGGCHAVASPREGSGDYIAMTNSCFSPMVLRTAPGTTVIFENRDEAFHEVVGGGNEWSPASDAAPAGSQLRPGLRATVTFKEAGVYPYTCMLHRGMTGTIIVGEGITGAAVPVSLAPQPVRETPPPAAAPATGSSAQPGSGPWFTAAWAAAGLLTGGGATTALFTARSRSRARSG